MDIGLPQLRALPLLDTYYIIAYLEHENLPGSPIPMTIPYLQQSQMRSRKFPLPIRILLVTPQPIILKQRPSSTAGTTPAYNPEGVHLYSKKYARKYSVARAIE